MSFLELHFLGKTALLGLGRRPQPLKKPSFLRENEAQEMIPKLWQCQNLRKAKGIFVMVCGICPGVDKMQFFR